MAGQPITLVSVSAEGRSPDGPRRRQIDAFDPARTFCSRETWRKFGSRPPIPLFPPRRSNEAARRAPVRRVDHANNADAPVGTGADRATTQGVCAQGGEAFRAFSKEASMARTLSTSITRRSVVAGLAITAAPLSLASADKAYAQDKQASREKVCMSGWAAFSPSRQ